MNDRYLCKAKRIDNGEWLEGYYVKGKWFFDKKEIYAILSLDVCFYPGCEIDEWIEVDPSTICQYTGLTDENGNMIWENDIVRYYDDLADTNKEDLVKWNETHASFVRLHKSKMGLQYLYIDECIANRCEVIGNVFDNPELLEGGKEAAEFGNQDLLMPTT